MMYLRHVAQPGPVCQHCRDVGSPEQGRLAIHAEVKDRGTGESPVREPVGGAAWLPGTPAGSNIHSEAPWKQSVAHGKHYFL